MSDERSETTEQPKQESTESTSVPAPRPDQGKNLNSEESRLKQKN